MSIQKMRVQTQKNIDEVVYLLKVVSRNQPFDNSLYNKLVSRVDLDLGCYKAINSGEPLPYESDILKEVVELSLDHARQDCNCDHAPNTGQIKQDSQAILAEVLATKISTLFLVREPQQFFNLWRSVGGTEGSLVKELDKQAQDTWAKIRAAKRSDKEVVASRKMAVKEKAIEYKEILSDPDFKPPGEEKIGMTLFIFGYSGKEKSVDNPLFDFKETVDSSGKRTVVEASYVLPSGKTRTFYFNPAN